MKLALVFAALPLAFVPRLAAANPASSCTNFPNPFFDSWEQENPVETTALGTPVGASPYFPDGEGPKPYNGGYYQSFANGTLWIDTCRVSSQGTIIGGAITNDLISNKYDLLEAGAGFMRYPTSSTFATPTNDGWVNYFEFDELDGYPDGAIFASPSTGAFEMNGIIFQEYTDVGETANMLGYPVSDERACTLPHCASGGRENRMVNGFMEYAPFGGLPVVPNPAWGMLNVNKQSSRLAVIPFGIGRITGIDIKSYNWPGSTVRISLNTVGGRVVLGTLPVVNGVFELVDNNISYTSGIAGAGNAAGHVVGTVEATTMTNGIPGFTQLSAVVLQ